MKRLIFKSCVDVETTHSKPLMLTHGGSRGNVSRTAALAPAFMEQCTHLAQPQMFYLTFAVDFSVFLGLSGRLEALATFCTSEAVLVPRL